MVDYYGDGILGKKKENYLLVVSGNEVVTMIDYIGNIRFFDGLAFFWPWYLTFLWKKEAN